MTTYPLRVPLIAATASYMVLVFALDAISPLGIEVWVMNLPVILVPVVLKNVRLVLAATAACAVLAIVGSAISPAGANPPWWDLLNRGMGISAMCVIAAMGVNIIQRSNALDAARRSLEWESEAHRQTARSLEKHVERLRLATEGAGMGAFDVDLENARVYCSAALLKLVGQSSELDRETALDTWEAWLHPDDAERVREARALALRERAPFAIEHRIVRSDADTTAWLAVFGRYCYNAAGAAVRLLGVAFDISRRKELEREVLGREVLALVSGQQREVGQALHDTVGQELTGLGLIAHSLAARLPDGAVQTVARRLIAGIEGTHRTVRELSRGLIPVHVESRGLFAALEDLAARMTQQSGVAVTVQYSEYFESPDHETATQLFHIAQEAVTNAVRHGRPRAIRLSLLPEPDGLRLRVSDDGVGIDPRPDRDDGLGLRIMHYRAGLIGARLNVGLAQSGGTVVACTVPWSDSHERNNSR